MSNNSHELTPDSEPLPPAIRAVIDAVFGMSKYIYDLLVKRIPDIETSDYVFGVEIEEALTLSSNRVWEAKEELEPYCALLSLALASRFLRNTFPPDQFDDQADDPEGRAFDITRATDLVLDRVEAIEGLDIRSERQTTILQICYLILTEGELGRGNPIGLASEYFSAACAFPSINYFPAPGHKLDQDIRRLCLSWCWMIEDWPKKQYENDYFWDLTDREVLQFYSGLLKTQVVPHQYLPLTNLSNIVTKESVELKSLLPESLGTAEEPGSWQPFNTSFKELLEAVGEFRKRASDDDVNDGDNPSESEPTTSAFWCWQFGQLVGTVAKDLDRD